MVAQMARVDVRMEPEVKRMWERAAAIAGVPLSAFIKMATSQCASELISANSTMTLNAEDTAWFIDLLRQPAPEPTPAMRRASARRRELLGG
jgi:uncharacterized protein (DUF1778 family)